MSRPATTCADLKGAYRLRRPSHGLRSALPWQPKLGLHFLLRCAQVRALLPPTECSSSSSPSSLGVPEAAAGQCSQPGFLVCRSVRRTEPGDAIKSRSTQARGVASGHAVPSSLPRGALLAPREGLVPRRLSGHRLELDRSPAGVRRISGAGGLVAPGVVSPPSCRALL